MIYRARRRPKALITASDIQVLILHHHLMSMYDSELAKLYEAQGQPELSKFHRLKSNQQNNMYIFYQTIGAKMERQRDVYKVRSWMFSVGLVMLVMGLLFIAPVMSQEATVEPTLPVVIDEVEPVPDVQPPVVVVEQPTEPSGGFNLTSFMGGIITGALGSLGIIFGFVGKYVDNTPALNAIEWLGKSAPPDMVKAVNEVAIKMAAAAEVLVKVTDGLPNEPGPITAESPQRLYPKKTIPSGDTQPLPEDDDLDLG